MHPFGVGQIPVDRLREAGFERLEVRPAAFRAKVAAFRGLDRTARLTGEIDKNVKRNPNSLSAFREFKNAVGGWLGITDKYWLTALAFRAAWPTPLAFRPEAEPLARDDIIPGVRGSWPTPCKTKCSKRAW